MQSWKVNILRISVNLIIILRLFIFWLPNVDNSFEKSALGFYHMKILLEMLTMFTAFIIYIFIEILKELLLKSVEIKAENELTI